MELFSDPTRVCQLGHIVLSTLCQLHLVPYIFKKQLALDETARGLGSSGGKRGQSVAIACTQLCRTTYSPAGCLPAYEQSNIQPAFRAREGRCRNFLRHQYYAGAPGSKLLLSGCLQVRPVCRLADCRHSDATAAQLALAFRRMQDRWLTHLLRETTVSMPLTTLDSFHWRGLTPSRLVLVTHWRRRTKAIAARGFSLVCAKSASSPRTCGCHAGKPHLVVLALIIEAASSFAPPLLPVLLSSPAEGPMLLYRSRSPPTRVNVSFA